MSLDEALAAVQAAIVDEPSLRIAEHGIREDDTHYLVPVLDTRQMRDAVPEPRPSASRLLVVDKAAGTIERVTVADALARAKLMRAVLP